MADVASLRLKCSTEAISTSVQLALMKYSSVSWYQSLAVPFRCKRHCTGISSVFLHQPFYFATATNFLSHCSTLSSLFPVKDSICCCRSMPIKDWARVVSAAVAGSIVTAMRLRSHWETMMSASADRICASVLVPASPSASRPASVVFSSAVQEGSILCLSVSYSVGGSSYAILMRELYSFFMVWCRVHSMILSPNFFARLRLISSVATTLVIAAPTPAFLSWQLSFLHG